MATTKEGKEFIMEHLTSIGNVTARPMMGEYCLYLDGVLFGGIYDERVLVKKVSENEKFNLDGVIPYKGAKEMLWIEDIENHELLRSIIFDTAQALAKKK